MGILNTSLAILAAAAEGDPVKTTIVIMLFYAFFNVVEAVIEKIIFGARFEHWLDLVFALCFIAYSAAAVFACAEFNSNLPG